MVHCNTCSKCTACIGFVLLLPFAGFSWYRVGSFTVEWRAEGEDSFVLTCDEVPSSIFYYNPRRGSLELTCEEVFTEIKVQYSRPQKGRPAKVKLRSLCDANLPFPFATRSNGTVVPSYIQYQGGLRRWRLQTQSEPAALRKAAVRVGGAATEEDLQPSSLKAVAGFKYYREDCDDTNSDAECDCMLGKYRVSSDEDLWAFDIDDSIAIRGLQTLAGAWVAGLVGVITCLSFCLVACCVCLCASPPQPPQRQLPLAQAASQPTSIPLVQQQLMQQHVHPQQAQAFYNHEPTAPPPAP